MLEETVDNIIHEHWTDPDSGIYVKTDGIGVYGDVEKTAYDVTVEDNHAYITPQPSHDDNVIATITYDNHPIIDLHDDTHAHIDYKAHPSYQNGLLRPVHRSVNNNRQAPLLTPSQVKNAIAGVRPRRTHQIFKDGLTEVNLSRTNGQGQTHTIHATYQGLRFEPDQDNYDIIVQGITRPHGEHPPRPRR